MAETRAVTGRARSKEEEYFLRAEAELLEKVRSRAAKAGRAARRWASTTACRTRRS